MVEFLESSEMWLPDNLKLEVDRGNFRQYTALRCHSRHTPV